MLLSVILTLDIITLFASLVLRIGNMCDPLHLGIGINIQITIAQSSQVMHDGKQLCSRARTQHTHWLTVINMAPTIHYLPPYVVRPIAEMQYAYTYGGRNNRIPLLLPTYPSTTSADNHASHIALIWAIVTTGDKAVGKKKRCKIHLQIISRDRYEWDP